jgi:hypothetical protein
MTRQSPKSIYNSSTSISHDTLGGNTVEPHQLASKTKLTLQPHIKPILCPWRGPLILLGLNGDLHPMSINKGIHPKLRQYGLTLDIHPPRLRMDTMKSDKTFEIRFNTLRLAAPNIDTQFHKARGLQLMKLEVEPLQNSNN